MNSLVKVSTGKLRGIAVEQEQKTESQIEGKIEIPVLATGKTPAPLEHCNIPSISASICVSA